MRSPKDLLGIFLDAMIYKSSFFSVFLQIVGICEMSRMIFQKPIVIF